MSKVAFEFKNSLEGRYRLRVLKADGKQRADTGWFGNVITDEGLNRFGSEYFTEACVVGSGNSTPSTSDTALDSFIGICAPNSGTVTTSARGVQTDEAPYFAYVRRKYTFRTGDAEGNVSEVGLTWNRSSEGEDLFSRALILDENENETTITVLDDEILVVEYELRVYPDFSDQVTNVTDGGPAGTTHTLTQRVNRFSNWKAPHRRVTTMRSPGGGLGELGDPMVNNTPSKLSTPALPFDLPKIQPYVNNSHERTYKMEAGINTWHSEDIEFMTLQFDDGGGYPDAHLAWQVEIDPPIQKTNQDKLTMEFKFSWARR